MPKSMPIEFGKRGHLRSGLWWCIGQGLIGSCAPRSAWPPSQGFAGGPPRLTENAYLPSVSAEENETALGDLRVATCGRSTPARDGRDRLSRICSIFLEKLSDIAGL